MDIQNSAPQCSKLSKLKPDDEWWFYQCAGGVPEDTTGVLTESDIRKSLYDLQKVFDNKWYVKYGNLPNGGICANLLLGGMQNTIGNIMRLASNISRLGGINLLGKRIKENLRNISKCKDTMLELEVLSCFIEDGLSVVPYPVLPNRRVPDGKVTISTTDIFIEITHNEWPRPDDFPGLNWKSKQGNKIIEKCINEVKQLPNGEAGTIILNPPTLIDQEIGRAILEAMHGFLLPGLYSRISGIILANKLMERSGFLKACPIVISNAHAFKRCDNELLRLAEALWKHP